MTWQRLSQRASGTRPDGPYEGVPDHISGPLGDWLFEILQNASIASTVAIQLRVGMSSGLPEFKVARLLVAAASGDQNLCLDMADAVLHFVGNYGGAADRLRLILALGASVWTVADGDDSLMLVVQDETQAAYAQATSVHDDASDELRTAWANAFGRNGDPSDAWDHAIKAVEDILIPVVLPSKPKATLGQVLHELENRKTSGLWQMILPGADKSRDVAPLVAMLRLMWPNHDRHGGIMAKRTPSEAEARAVVALAATIMQWHRESWVVQKR